MAIAMAENLNRRFDESMEVNAKAHQQEECAQQQALEWLDNSFNGAAVFGFSQCQPGDKGAKRHGEAGIVCEHAGANGNEKDSRHEQVRTVYARNQPQQRPQRETADTDDQANCQYGLGKGYRDALQNRAGTFPAQDADHQQDGDYRQVLKQQDGKAGPAGLGTKPLIIGIELNDDGGG